MCIWGFPFYKGRFTKMGSCGPCETHGYLMQPDFRKGVPYDDYVGIDT